MRLIKVGKHRFVREQVTSTADHPDRNEFFVTLGNDTIRFTGREAKLVRLYFAKQLTIDLEAELGDRIDPAPVMLHPDTWRDPSTPEYSEAKADTTRWPIPGTAESAEHGPRCTCEFPMREGATGSGHQPQCPVEQAFKARSESLVRELFEERARTTEKPQVPAWATADDGCGESVA